MIVGNTIGQEQFICQEYMQRPTGAQRIRLGERGRLPNGRSSGMRPEDFDPAQIAIGTAVELEHTADVRIARKIATDRLAEDPNYYRMLATLHLDGAQLGGFREDFVSTVGIVMGKAKATKFLDDFEALVEQRAAAGAERKVKPLVVGAMALAGVGLLLGGVALVVAMRR